MSFTFRNDGSSGGVDTGRSRRLRWTFAVGACCLFLLASCGDDDDDDDAAAATDATTTTGSPATTEDVTATTADSAPAPTEEVSPTTDEAPVTSEAGAVGTGEPALCDAYLEATAAFAGEPDPAVIGGLLDRIDAAAPDELSEQFATITGGARTVLETGDFSVFESPEFDEAVTAADGWVFDNCAFVTTAEIQATEYRYEGQASEYPQGRTGFTLVNEGAEAHELAIIRKNDGVELSLEELLQLPESDAETMTSYVGGTFVGPPGGSANLILDLSPGDYIAVCNIPAGTTVAEDGSFVEGTGEPHVMLGMSFEFTVR